MPRKTGPSRVDPDLKRTIDSFLAMTITACERGLVVEGADLPSATSRDEQEILRLLERQGGTMHTMPATMRPDDAMSALNDLARKGLIILDVVPAPGMMSFRIAVRSVTSIRASQA